MASKRGVIPSKRISYLYTPLEINAAKRRRKDTSKASSNIKKIKIAMPLSLSCTDVQCARATGEWHEPIKVDVMVEATAEDHNIIVYNPSTASKEEEKVEPASSGERKIYPFEGFNISDEAPKKLMRYCQQQSEVFRNEECLINIIKDFSISASLPWNLVDDVYIPINCGDEFHWVLAVVILKESRIQVYDSMSQRRCFGPLSEIQKLTKIFSTYLDMSSFLMYNMLKELLNKSLVSCKYKNCGLLLVAYTEYLNDGLQVPNDGLDVGLLHKRYVALLWKYGEVKAQKSYASDTKDPRRPKPNFVISEEEQLVHID
ncbi:hypothetical protein CQW23_00880 [Capsicum baccatum]|uniref:Ubiquitin-like protease family profile domain-containing protein n=1 Tax=Capsicum baccatum TaxID=33114 RepID=A0A2G2XM08_CAPBA|nr:hypothetical protein CQW23_00880 [Capsicum baccatum]